MGSAAGAGAGSEAGPGAGADVSAAPQTGQRSGAVSMSRVVTALPQCGQVSRGMALPFQSKLQKQAPEQASGQTQGKSGINLGRIQSERRRDDQRTACGIAPRQCDTRPVLPETLAIGSLLVVVHRTIIKRLMSGRRKAAIQHALGESARRCTGARPVASGLFSDAHRRYARKPFSITQEDTVCCLAAPCAQTQTLRAAGRARRTTGDALHTPQPSALVAASVMATSYGERTPSSSREKEFIGMIHSAGLASAGDIRRPCGSRSGL